MVLIVHVSIIYVCAFILYTSPKITSLLTPQYNVKALLSNLEGFHCRLFIQSVGRGNSVGRTLGSHADNPGSSPSENVQFVQTLLRLLHSMDCEIKGVSIL